MNLEEVKKLLAEAGYQVAEEKRLKNDTGMQLRLVTGQYVNVFDKGTYSIQGKDPGTIKNLLDEASRARASAAPPNRRAFVVYGHDEAAKTELEAMLRRWAIEPLILDQLPSEGMTIIEKLEHYQNQVHFAVVLATPDGRRAPSGPLVGEGLPGAAERRS